MKTILLSLCSIAVLSFASCKCKKSAPVTSVASEQPSPVNTSSGGTSSTSTISTGSGANQSANNTGTASQEGIVRFLVSFYSKGSGIDASTKNEFVKFMDGYPKKIIYAPTHWGRGGEIDYCLALNELSSSEQADFIKRANGILAKSTLVHVKENAKCDHLNSPTPPNTPLAEDTYRLVVSFYSTAAGIDAKTHDVFIKFLNSYSKKIAYEPTHWGREGEVDYCLKLSELAFTEQADFVKKAKDVLSKSTLVHIHENAKCAHKR